MAQYYNAGERKNRPGTYFRYENRGKASTVGTTANSVAVPIQSNWGPFEVTVHESATSVISAYGAEGTTIDAALALFEGGAPKVYCVRLGSESAAEKATLKLGDNINIEAKYAGTKAIKVQVRVKVEGASKELVVYDGDTKVESFPFVIGGNEAASLVAAVKGSAYITATTTAENENTVAVADATVLAGGSDPSVSTASYSEALTKLEPYKFTHITLDTVETAVQTLLTTWLGRVFEDGKLCVGIFGGNNSTDDFATKLSAALALNDMKCIRYGDYGKDADGNVVDGYKMAALVAGAIADTPSNESIVHKTVPGIVSIEPHTNGEYESAIAAGLLLASYSASGAIWFDSGVNTLTNLDANEDEGFKKIRRVATRFELINRIDEALAPLVGRVNCDNDGIALAVERGQGVINAMIAEGKLKEGSEFYEDTENPHEGDSAWFVIAADDYDSLEKIYQKYAFRFSSNS